MATTYYTDIQKLYVAYFNRPADDAGLKYYEGVLEGAKDPAATMAVISADFAKSSEYTAAFSGKSNAEIVDIIYTNIFGHAADAAGNKFYADNLAAGKVTVANVVQEVAKGAQGTDLNTYNNKLAAAAAFTAAVDTDGEKAGYTGDAANKIAKAWLAGVTDSTSLAASTTPAALNTVVAKAVVAGTPFTVASALTNLNAANASMKSFLASADGDNDATTSTTAQKIHNAQDAAEAEVTGMLTGGRATLYAGTDSTIVKQALLADQASAYATTLSNAQSDLTIATANVAKVAGLQAAIDAQTSAGTAVTAAGKAVTAAAADLAAKVASYNVNHSAATAQITVDAETGIASINGAAVFKVDAGKLVLVDGVKEADYSGITSVLNASNAKETADLAKANADKVLTAATLNVHHLDVTDAETAALKLVAAKMTGLGTNELPTEAQITTYTAQLKAIADLSTATAEQKQAYTDYVNLVNSYHTAAESDPLVSILNTKTTAATAAGDNVSDFADAMAALNAANTTEANLAGYEATVAVTKQVFADAGYNLVTLDTDGVSQIAGTKSDVFVVGKKDATINLFNLQGKDALSIGSGYTLNTGKLSAGDDAKLEVFVSQASNGTDTIVKLESHAFSSHVTGAVAPEIVTITLVGVNAANAALDANGILTFGGTTA